MTESNRPLFTEDAGKRDAAWVHAVLAGDSGAFGNLVETYQRAAVATSYRLLSNSDDAQEVAQEAFLKAYQSLSRLNDPTRFGPWLLRIVSNLSLNARRSRKSSQSVTLDEELGTGDDSAPRTVNVGPERRTENRELQAAIDNALEQLPEKQRMALLLFTVEGWAQKDIAEVLECSLETVKWNVFQGRKRLKELLGDQLTK